jgi:hypothetical protein
LTVVVWASRRASRPVARPTADRETRPAADRDSRPTADRDKWREGSDMTRYQPQPGRPKGDGESPHREPDIA